MALARRVTAAPGLGLTPDQLAEVFPFHVAVDAELRVVQRGPVIARLLPELVPRAPLVPSLVIRRPEQAQDFAAIRTMTDHMFVLESASHLVLHGRMVPVAEDRLLFLGSPSHSSASALGEPAIPDTGPALRDPAPEDSAARAAMGASRFLGRVSHELRTPMHGVLGTTRLLLATALSAEQRELAETVHRSAGGLLQALDEILDAARREAGTPDLEALDVALVTAAAPRHPRLLLVEDHPVNQALALALLTQAGYRCDLAPDGYAALAQLERREYAAVLMDCQMPGLDGWDTTGEIRRREAHRSARRVPIIAMTANALGGDRERCLSAGMDDYVAKPLDPAALEATLARWIRPAEAPATGPAAVDPAVLGALGQQHPTRAGDLLREFLRDAPERLGAIHGALLRGDAAVAQREAYTLKCMAWTVGAVALGNAAAALEHDAREPGRLATLPSHLSEALTALAAALPALEAAQGRLSGTTARRAPSLEGPRAASRAAS